MLPAKMSIESILWMKVMGGLLVLTLLRFLFLCRVDADLGREAALRENRRLARRRAEQIIMGVRIGKKNLSRPRRKSEDDAACRRVAA